MTIRIDKVVTSGTFALDGGEWDVDNNIWLIGDDASCYIIDAAHEADPIIEAVGDRKVLGVLLTHGHNDHVTVAPELAERFDAPIFLHPGDDMLWQMTHPEVGYEEIADQEQFPLPDGTFLIALNTPGHSPGSTVFYAPEHGVLFGGDTLFNGGPGATGNRSFASFDTIIESLRTKVLELPDDTIVHTGHGDDTTIGGEAPHLDEWIERGY